MPWQKRMEAGWPPCSPQMPTFMSGRELRPQPTASSMSRPTPLTSSTSNGLSWRMRFWLYMGRNLFSASSREKEKVAWVRSLVPKEKNSASSARLSARMQARTTSIMVPNLKSRRTP